MHIEDEPGCFFESGFKIFYVKVSFGGWLAGAIYEENLERALFQRFVFADDEFAAARAGFPVYESAVFAVAIFAEAIKPFARTFLGGFKFAESAKYAGDPVGGGGDAGENRECDWGVDFARFFEKSEGESCG